MAVTDDDKGIVVEGMSDDVFVKIVLQVAVEPRPDVFVNRFQLDKDQRQAIDEADEVGPAVVVGRTQPGDF